MSNPIKDEEDFKKLSAQMIEMTQKVFCDDKQHSHMIFLIAKDQPGLGVLLFDQVAKQVMRETKRGEPLAHADRDRTFNAIASVAYQTRALGYFEIAEGWGLIHNVSHDDPKMGEKMLEQYRKALKEHTFIQNMPIKEEILTIRGRFLGTMMSYLWKIRRQGERVWLEPVFKESPEKCFMPYRFDEISRAGAIDHAIDRVIEEEKAKVTS